MPESKQPGKRGGRREGAGRPRTDSKVITLRVPGNMARWLDKQPNKSDFIKKCIAQSYNPEKEWACLGNVYAAANVHDMKLPFVDIRVAAGFPIPLDNSERGHEIELLKMLCPNPDASYLIRVEGNSMIDAGIYSGDIVIVDKSNRQPNETQVAVCELNGEYTLKRFVKRNNEGWLIPANPDYPEIKVSPHDNFNIWGTVTYVIHKPRG